MLSIIIISKQEETTLPKLLESLILNRKTFADFEIILSDAGSTDKTREIAKAFGCKIIEGGFPSIGRNNGARVAQGEVLLFLDADVILPESFIKKNLNEFNARNLACASVINVPLSPKIIDKIIYGIYNIFAGVVQYFDPHGAGVCIFCRQDIFIKIKGFDERLLLGEDMEFCKRAGKVGKFRILKSVPIFCNIRRLEKDGRLNISLKCLKGFLFRTFIGEQYHPTFDYELQGGVKIRKHHKL